MDCLPHILALALHSQGGFNTAVPGLGLFCRSDSIIAGAGAYANSEKAVDRKVSQYLLAGATAQASPQPIRFDSRSFAASVGAVSPSAVNYNVLAGAPTEITAAGSDANISLTMRPKGTGRHVFYS